MRRNCILPALNQNLLLSSALKRLSTLLAIFSSRTSWGVYGDGVTPDPIPNSEVKPVCGNTSAREILCKGSSMPHFLLHVSANTNGVLAFAGTPFCFSASENFLRAQLS